MANPVAAILLGAFDVALVTYDVLLAVAVFS